MSRPRLLLALLPLLLAACASRPPAGRDGPGANPPAKLDQVPDAVPRIEPLRNGGPNKPYEVLGRRYVPMNSDEPLSESGLASWYGRKFHGRPTASGETYDMYAMTAAHKTMPLPSYARVRNPANGREVVVRVNDRGPFEAGRVIDLSYTAALKLGVLNGVAPVQVQRLTFEDIRNGGWQAAPRVTPPDDPAPGERSAMFDTAGFWLQLGAFRARDGAVQLQQRVARQAEGLPGVAVFDDAGLFRVQAGPYPNRDDALAAAAAVQRQTGIAGVVVERP
jgi:rare lipoprotein A